MASGLAHVTKGRAVTTRRGRGRWWLLAVALGPLYLLSLALMARTLIILVATAGISSAQLVQAALTFLAAVLGTSITAAGLWLARAQNQRTESRLMLETVATGLNLIGQGDGYAPSAKVAGALATLIHLNYPAIAIRALRAAWLDDAVDAETAVWLIGEVMQSGTHDSQLEAARLLYGQADKLTELRSDGSLEWHWPNSLFEYWPVGLHQDVRGDLLRALIAMLLSRPRPAWERQTSYLWIAALLDEVIRLEGQPPGEKAIAGQAAHLQAKLLPLLPAVPSVNWRTGQRMRKAMAERAENAKSNGIGLTGFEALEKRLEDWVRPSPPASRVRRDSPAYKAGAAFRRRLAGRLSRRRSPGRY